MPESPLVTAAILAYNRREELRVTLATLRDQLDYPSDRLEVVVVDNASTDGTAEMVRAEHPEVQLIEEPVNAGVPAWNRAFGVARGDYVLVLDDDCAISGDALARAVTAARTHDADLVSFFVSSPGEHRDFSESFATGLLSFWGCAALISRRALDRLGGFDDEIFLWGHELEFTIRFLDAGFRHLYLPEVDALHRKPPVEGFNARAFGLNHRNHAYIAAKLLRPRDAATAVARLALSVAAEGAIHREALGAASELAGGVRAGLRARRPVHPAVSRIYRRDFIGFAGPAPFIRGPLERWRGRRDPQAGATAVRRAHERYYAERARLYPRAPAALRLAA